jgi:hypothetical protein
MMMVMLRQQVLAGLRQLVVVLVQALEGAARAGHVGAERLHVTTAGLLPLGHPGLHLTQVLLALGRQLVLVLLEACAKRARAWAERLETITKAAGPRRHTWAKRP